MIIIWCFGLTACMAGDFDETLSYADALQLVELLNRPDVRREIHVPISPRVFWNINDGKLRQLEGEFNSVSEGLSAQDRQELHRRVLVQKLRLASERLNSDQLTRLREIHLQYKALKGGTPQAIEAVVELSSHQRLMLKDLEEELGEQLREMLLAFDRKVRNEFQGSLTPEQRVSWAEKSGEHFEFTSSFEGLQPLGALP